MSGSYVPRPNFHKNATLMQTFATVPTHLPPAERVAQLVEFFQQHEPTLPVAQHLKKGEEYWADYGKMMYLSADQRDNQVPQVLVRMFDTNDDFYRKSNPAWGSTPQIEQSREQWLWAGELIKLLHNTLWHYKRLDDSVSWGYPRGC